MALGKRDNSGRRNRKRYIVFLIAPGSGLSDPLPRGALIHAINKGAREAGMGTAPRLTIVEGDGAIVAIGHGDKDATIRMLSSLSIVDGRSVSVRTVGTSGTIKKAKVMLASKGKRCEVKERKH